MNKLVSTVKTNDSIGEAYKIMRTNLMYRNFDKELKVINVVSTVQDEAKTTTITNLANVYAMIGKKVLLIDLDLRKPTVHKKLGIRNQQGINDYLSGVASFGEVVRKYDENFYVITSGTKTKYYTELLHSERLKVFLKEMKSKFDLILIDCPPVSALSDGLIISTLSDATIMVVKYNHIDRREVKRTYEQLLAVNANVIGSVMTNVDINQRRYKNYYAYYNDEDSSNK